MIGTRIVHYEVREKLGAGGMGSTGSSACVT